MRKKQGDEREIDYDFVSLQGFFYYAFCNENLFSSTISVFLSDFLNS